MRWSLLAATLLVAGCGSLPARAPATTEVPPSPAYLQEVKVLPPKAGENVLQVAAREQDARLRANVIIGAARRDWECMRSRLAGRDDCTTETEAE